MTEVLGPHLLGRIPSPPDERDFKLSNFMAFGDLEMGTTDPAELIALGEAELKLTTTTFKKWAATQYTDVTKTHWWRAFNCFAQAKENLIPPPPPPSGLVEWDNSQPILDQMDTNHCVGFSGAQWGNTSPVNDRYTNRDGHALYYECKVIDGEPNSEDGTVMRSIAKALKARGRISAYAFAASVDEAIEWVKTKGPVMVGTDWYEEMFDPDPDGLAHAMGSLAGGHAYLINGFDADNDQLLYINSWGSNWAKDGHFKLSLMDANLLHRFEGVLLVTLELPIG